MADIELVIKIDKDYYDLLKNGVYCGDDYLPIKIIAHGTPLNEVLDEIRAEIDDLDRYYDNDYFSGNKDAMFKCNEVMQIIDKYREEQE